MVLFSWRGGSKIVSYIDLIIQANAVIWIFFRSTDDYDELLGDLYLYLTPLMDYLGMVLWALMFLLLLALLVSFEAIKVWAAIELMQAAEIGISAKTALEMCSFWRIVTVIWLIWNIVQSYIDHRFKKTIVFHTVALFVVTLFMRELQLPPPMENIAANRNSLNRSTDPWMMRT